MDARTIIRIAVFSLLLAMPWHGQAQTALPPPPALPPLTILDNSLNPPAMKFLTILTGSTSGVYYFVGSAMCRMLYSVFHERDMHCAPLRSRGTRDNINLLTRGEGTLAIIQPEMANMPGGSAPIQGGMSVMSLHSESAVMVVGHGVKINSLRDLRGKIVDLGTTEPETTAKLLQLSHIGPKDIVSVKLLSIETKSAALCDGSIDAFMVWIGHPAAAVSKLIEKCGATVVGLWVPGAEDILRHAPYLSRQEIRAGVYPGMSTPIQTLGPRAILIASATADEDLVYSLTKAIFEGLETFRTLHPALGSLTAESMVNEGNFLPFHPGAARYYKEHRIGLLFQ